jgi:hypothetical protein
MNVNVSKIILYVVLAVMAIYSGRGFVSRYSRLMDTNVDADPLALLDGKPTVDDTGSPLPGDTNDVPVVSGDEPPVEATTPPATDETKPDDAPATETNQAPAAVTPVTTTTRPEPEFLTKRSMDRGRAPDTSGLALYAFALFGTLIALGFIVAHDVSSLLGQKAHKLLHNEEGEGIHSVAYDQAEEVWANGEYLEAIRLMREYLAKNPREVHVMARIAEIYEKDLGNYLAAALEYEEFLNHKIPAERWAWSAIHLVNLYYGKLDKPAQGLALLWRIHREYGKTQAAAKARKRLLQIDPDFAKEQARLDREAAEAGDEEPPAAAESSTESATETGTRVYQMDDSELEPEGAIWEPPAEDADSHLPKGFRPKKR